MERYDNDEKHYTFLDDDSTPPQPSFYERHEKNLDRLFALIIVSVVAIAFVLFGIRVQKENAQKPTIRYTVFEDSFPCNLLTEGELDSPRNLDDHGRNCVSMFRFDCQRLRSCETTRLIISKILPNDDPDDFIFSEESIARENRKADSEDEFY